jgi:hypothetical protein
MPGAEDVAAVARQIAVVERRQRPGGMGAAVDEAAGVLALSDHEPREHPGALAEPEALAAGIRDLTQRAEPDARGRPRRVVGLKAGQEPPGRV